MKKEVRPIDANATIEALKANFQQGSWYGCEDPLYQIAEDTIAEMPTILPAASGDPLTLEQLRGMDGQPVWVDFTGSNFERPAGWFILRSIENGEAYLVGKTSVYKALEYYGKVWRAYTYPPAHIDREAWTAEWIYPENEFNLPRCSKCGCNSKDAQYSHKDNFCPKCGRAMTQEGRAIMENRLRG